ncbi:hypothetical protein WICPIJ_000269 [Wickerhamomyces pijperi]|uniref:Uncharacterized protein n=1 Tax=Wickerhamomyces pijperi TaxID=599730 RepID=A0A9P8QE10_WICPI|nr:hypothetical protein WICPIJ_000269 [Wickerhamomyces pijperi]
MVLVVTVLVTANLEVPSDVILTGISVGNKPTRAICSVFEGKLLGNWHVPALLGGGRVRAVNVVVRSVVNRNMVHAPPLVRRAGKLLVIGTGERVGRRTVGPRVGFSVTTTRGSRGQR